MKGVTKLLIIGVILLAGCAEIEEATPEPQSPQSQSSYGDCLDACLVEYEDRPDWEWEGLCPDLHGRAQ